MGQKIGVEAFRLMAMPKCLPSSRWVKDGVGYGKYVLDDKACRDYINGKYKAASVNEIEILRSSQSAQVKIYCAKPGIIIGRRGEDIENLRVHLANLLGVPTNVSVEEIKKADLYAKIVAENIAGQLQRRAAFRKVLKRAVQNTMRQGALGIKIVISGRIGGAEIARSEKISEGRLPLHTIKANIDYSIVTAKTVYGIIGVKVWIYKGDFSE